MKRFALCLMLVMLSACKPQAEKMNGYVEGEYLYIAPSSPGILKTLSVARGQEVKQGQPLFSIDTTALQASLDAAQAEVTQDRARLEDLEKGARPEEIEVIRQQKEQADANLVNAQKEYDRAKGLLKTNAISQSVFDQRKAAFEAAQARVGELSAQLETAKLGGRKDAVDAARALVDIARQKVLQAQKLLDEAQPAASAAGRVEDTYFRPGEFVPAGTPVVSLLPPENVKIRFFVPQAKLPQMQPGREITVTCDGCKTPVRAKITYIASQAEYTPPVIYSVGSRDKLVFMVEAHPEAFDAQMRPGLPVDISLGKDGSGKDGHE